MDAGAKSCDSVAEVVKQSDIVLCCLSDPSACEEVCVVCGARVCVVCVCLHILHCQLLSLSLHEKSQGWVVHPGCL